jgi:hypothetical protein
VFEELRALWHARRCQDEYFGTLINAWLSDGGAAVGVKAGTDYVDIGTLNGYRAALTLLASITDRAAPTVGWPAGRLLTEKQPEALA